MTTPIPDWAREAAHQLCCVDHGATETITEWAQTIADAHSRATQTLSCVMCGQAYPPGTPASQAEALTAHIKTCEKHPLAIVRRALVGLVGVDTAEELDQMDAAMRAIPAPDEDKAAILNAIHALKATL